MVGLGLLCVILLLFVIVWKNGSMLIVLSCVWIMLFVDDDVIVYGMLVCVSVLSSVNVLGFSGNFGCGLGVVSCLCMWMCIVLNVVGLLISCVRIIWFLVNEWLMICR